MTFIKFRRPDTKTDVISVEVAVAIEKIASIEAHYYKKDDTGQELIWALSRGEDSEDLVAKGAIRYFILRDELGTTYNSRTASAASQKTIADLWAEAK